MSAWKILLTDGLEENGKAILRASAEVDDRPGISADELLQVVGEYDALIVRGRTKVTPAVFDAGKKLKVVGRAGVGVDNIDLNAPREHNVTVVNSPSGHHRGRGRIDPWPDALRLREIAARRCHHESR